MRVLAGIVIIMRRCRATRYLPGPADLRARAERAEQQADAYRDELGKLRAGSLDTPAGTGSAPAAARTTRRTARTPFTCHGPLSWPGTGRKEPGR